MTGSNYDLSHELCDKAEQLLLAGLNKLQIAKELDCPYGKVCLALINAGYAVYDMDKERKELYGYDSLPIYRLARGAETVAPDKPVSLIRKASLIPCGLFIPQALVDKVGRDLRLLLTDAEKMLETSEN